MLKTPTLPSNIYSVVEPTINDALVLNHNFDDDYLDSSGNNSHLTNYATTFINENLTTSYVNFVNSSYLQIPTTFNPYDTWNSGAGITISFKIRTTACSTWGRIIDFQPSLNSTT